MSDVDAAWSEWQMKWVLAESLAGRLAGYTGNQLQEAAFMAGYRRALQDAAADLAAAANPDQVWQVADTIRNRAAAVGTKDGDDDE